MTFPHLEFEERGMTDHSSNKLTARAVSKMRRDWIAGASIYDLAAEHDVTHTTVRHHVEGLEREAKPRMGRPRSFDHARALKLLREGMTGVEVAHRMGVTPARISQLARAAA